MHPKITEIFEKHQEWLNNGGDRAIKTVREANLIEAINQALAEVETEARTAGYLEGVGAGWKSSARANGFALYPTFESYREQERADEQRRLNLGELPPPEQPPVTVTLSGHDRVLSPTPNEVSPRGDPATPTATSSYVVGRDPAAS